ncbi:MAG TPA: hypothetical protein V6D28_11495 [Leptolyngbyaceae cyanobacterium]
MTSNPHKPIAKSDSSDIDDSGFLDRETISDPADPDAIEMNSLHTEEVSQNSADSDTDIDDERQRRMMRRTPQ